MLLIGDIHGGIDGVRLEGSRTCSEPFLNIVAFLIEVTTWIFLIKKKKEKDNTIPFAMAVFW